MQRRKGERRRATPGSAPACPRDKTSLWTAGTGPAVFASPNTHKSEAKSQTGGICMDAKTQTVASANLEAAAGLAGC